MTTDSMNLPDGRLVVPGLGFREEPRLREQDSNL